VPDVLIDLGEVPGRDGAPGRRSSPVTAGARWSRSNRAVLGALSLLLVALSAGAVRQRRADPPVVLPARLADATFTDGNRLFLISAVPPMTGTDPPKRSSVRTRCRPRPCCTAPRPPSRVPSPRWCWPGTRWSSPP
jgi:hypothetical protein